MGNPIPKTGPVKIAVVGFGNMPDGSQKIRAVINDYISCEFYRNDKWYFEGEPLSPEEQMMLNTVWVGECKKVGLLPPGIQKECSKCKKIHTEIPNNSRPQLGMDDKTVMGWMWECECHNTLYFKVVSPGAVK